LLFFHVASVQLLESPGTPKTLKGMLTDRLNVMPPLTSIV
jgi:hypothetical protein